MRKSLFVLLATVLVASTAMAELQNVQVGGSLRIRGNWWTSEIIAWDDDLGNSLSFVEQRTRLNVKADFTDQVSAFIEVDSYDVWGEDFRSNYITGVDGRANTANDVEMYQAYIEANEMWGSPLRARIGRQELAFGSQWLVGVNDARSLFTGLSFDGIRLTYATDMFSVDAVWAKLAERSPLEEDGDVDLYALYGSYLGIEDVTIDAYWMLVRDGRAPAGLVRLALWDDGPDVGELHTIGLRGAGTLGAFDFEAEVAYQFGDAERVAVNPMDRTIDWRFWEDDESDFAAWGVNVEVGYTFDMAWTPRVYLGGAWLEGSDDEDLAFNRLFSNWEYSEFIDNTTLSNAWLIRAGVSAMPTEDLEVLLALTYYVADEALEVWDPHIFWPWDTEEEDQLGLELGLYATYNYSEDLSFEAGYAHLFVDDGLPNGNFVLNNGLANRPGWRGWFGDVSDDDPDYVYFETKICF